MALVDSVAEFVARVLALQLGDFAVKLAERGIDTYATLAFAINFTPRGDDAVFVNKLAILVLGSEDHLKEPAWRRLFVEAYTLTSANLARKAKLPTAERESRRKRLQDPLPGLKLEDQLDPSHRLIDAAHEMADKNVVLFIDSTTTEKVWKTDSAGYLKEFEERSRGPASVTDALQRRASAMDMGDLVPFETGDLWVQVLIAALQKDPLPASQRSQCSNCGWQTKSCGLKQKAVKELMFDP